MRKNVAGQAFLSTVLIIGGMMIIIAAAVAMLAAAFIDTGFGLQASNQAESVATAGVNDAFIQLVRDTSFSSTAYTVTVPNGSATVIVTQNSPAAPTASVLSTATVSGRTRKISAAFSINSTTGQVVLVAWQDVQ